MKLTTNRNGTIRTNNVSVMTRSVGEEPPEGVSGVHVNGWVWLPDERWDDIVTLLRAQDDGVEREFAADLATELELLIRGEEG